jgi:hypothetical protein
MTILLTQALRVGGVVLNSGTTQTFAADMEADIVARKGATYLTDPTPGKTVPVFATTDVTGVIKLSAGGVSLGGVGQTFTWATKPLASALTGQIFISDVGVGGSYWYSDGSKWRPVGGRVTLKNTIAAITNSAAPLVVLDYATMPAGLVSDGDTVEVWFSKERTGGVADTDQTDIRIGTVAATPGTTCGLTTAGLATTTIWLASRWAYRKESNITVRPMTIAGTVGLGAATVANQAISVDAMDPQTTYLQITSDLTIAGGEVVNLRGFRVTLIAGS